MPGISVEYPAMVRLPAGEFWMGENADDKFALDTERPRHRVVIRRPFYLGTCPVTVGEFRAFRPEYSEQGDDMPAVRVTWRDAEAYCAWLRECTGGAYRLPTEAEWEYAARAGSVTPYPWGDQISPEQANYLYDEQGNRIGPGQRTPVGSYPPNRLGLHDMLGNVCEWTADAWHPTYQDAPEDGSARTVSTAQPMRRVLRGGAWDYMPRLLRSSWRDSLAETSRRDNIGFRIACTL